MKYIIFLFALVLSISAFSQHDLKLEINHLVGNEDLEYNTDFTTPTGDIVQLERCEYYFSNITLTHDGGQTTELTDFWILVDAFDQEVYNLGNFDINQIESITFSVGVETPVNHDDPAAWPNAHPLAPQNPSMHWGWAAGYRFLAMEGFSGATGSNFDFQVHALGDVNYHDQTVMVSAPLQSATIVISLDADYLESFSNVSTSTGGITHGESGDAAEMLNNFRDSVFSADSSTGIEETSEANITLQIVPNPSMNGTTSTLELDVTAGNYTMDIIDITGKTVHSENLDGINTSVNLPSLQSGTYLINIKLENTVLATERWIVK